MSEQLWSDGWINHEIVDAFALTDGGVDSKTFRAVVARMSQMRDEYEQRITMLEGLEAAGDSAWRSLAKAACPCDCELPLIGYHMYEGEWRVRCRVCNRIFAAVEVNE